MIKTDALMILCRSKTFALVVALSSMEIMATDSIPEADYTRTLEIAAQEELPALHAAKLSFENPALMPFKREYSISDVKVVFHRDHQSVAFNPMAGKGTGFGSILADAYIKYKNSTIWGEASYSNGSLFDVKWNEGGEIDKSYPYFIGNALGGNLRRETYMFNGGFSNYNNKWTWGVAGGYKAILSYRHVDPRPKNLSGTLNIKLGGGYNVADKYIIALSMLFSKFRHSTDISFVSELGETKLYHLTGLGTHYVRFAGNGSNVFSDSYLYGISANLYPSGNSGAYLSGQYLRETFRHVIVDLNRLPLSSMWQNNLSVQAGWKKIAHTSFGVEAEYIWHRRHGTETIFGDQASNSYPKIGDLELFADNYYDLSLSAFFQTNVKSLHLWAKPYLSFIHHRQDYIMPRRFFFSDNICYKISLGAIHNILKKTQIALSFMAEGRRNTDSKIQFASLETTDSEIISLEECALQAINSEIVDAVKLGAQFKLTIAVSPKYAVGLIADYNWQRLKKIGIANDITAAIFLQF